MQLGERISADQNAQIKSGYESEREQEGLERTRLSQERGKIQLLETRLEQMYLNASMWYNRYTASKEALKAVYDDPATAAAIGDMAFKDFAAAYSDTEDVQAWSNAREEMKESLKKLATYKQEFAETDPDIKSSVGNIPKTGEESREAALAPLQSRIQALEALEAPLMAKEAIRSTKRGEFLPNLQNYWQTFKGAKLVYNSDVRNGRVIGEEAAKDLILRTITINAMPYQRSREKFEEDNKRWSRKGEPQGSFETEVKTPWDYWKKKLPLKIDLDWAKSESNALHEDHSAEIDQAHSKQWMQSELREQKNTAQAVRQTLTEQNYLGEEIKVTPKFFQHGQQTDYQIECIRISRDIDRQAEQAMMAKEDQAVQLKALKAREPKIFKRKWKEKVTASEETLNAKDKEYAQQLQAANTERWNIISQIERLIPVMKKLALYAAEYNVGKSNLQEVRVPEGLMRAEHLLSEVEKVIAVLEQENQLTDAEQKLLKRIKELGTLITEKEKDFDRA